MALEDEVAQLTVEVGNLVTVATGIVARTQGAADLADAATASISAAASAVHDDKVAADTSSASAVAAAAGVHNDAVAASTASAASNASANNSAAFATAAAQAQAQAQTIANNSAASATAAAAAQAATQTIANSAAALAASTSSDITAAAAAVASDKTAVHNDRIAADADAAATAADRVAVASDKTAVHNDRVAADTDAAATAADRVAVASDKAATYTDRVAADSAATAAAASAATASGEADAATAQALIATTQAGNAAGSATTATTQASIAATQAGVATAQAGTATTKASDASTFAAAALVAQAAAEVARDNAIAAERRIRQQSLGTFADDAAAVAWAAAQSPAITIITGTSYLNSTTDIFRYAVVTAGPTITWHDVTEDEAAQAALATASATAAQNALSDFLTRYVGPFNSTPTYVGDAPPWSVGALYWNRLQGKFYVWSGSGWDETDATAQQAKNDAVAAANSAIQVLAGSGSEDYTVNGICALSHGAVLSFPKGLAVIGGNLVATSSFITPSTAAKTVFNPDGTARQTGVNELAQSWRNGTRFGLLEGNGATNYWRNSENGAAWTIVAATPTVVSNALFGVLSLTTLTANSTSWARAQETKSVNAGDIVTFSGAAVAGNKTTATIYIAGSVSGNGLASQVVPTVKSGPGTIAADTTFGSIRMWRVNGLSASVPTELSFTMTCPSTETLTVQIGTGVYTGGASGDSAKFGRLQLEPGYGSSYTPSGASPTARAPDIWQLASGLAAQQLGQNATFILRATLLNEFPAADWIYQLLGDDTDSMIYVDNANFSANMWDSFSTANLPVYFPTSTPVREIGVAMTTSKDGRRKICINGGPVASDNKSQYSNSATTLTLGGGSVAYRSDLEIREIVSMSAFVDNDDALRVHARPYA
jgi:hypothetical protein